MFGPQPQKKSAESGDFNYILFSQEQLHFIARGSFISCSVSYQAHVGWDGWHAFGFNSMYV